MTQQVKIGDLEGRIKTLRTEITDIVISQEASKKNKDKLEKTLDKLCDESIMTEKDIARYKEAVDILRQVSDRSVRKSYEFIMTAVNKSLERMFPNQERRIKLKEFNIGVYPQLEIELYTEGGRKRSLKSNSGRGIGYIISFLVLLSIIVITKARRLVVLDEALGGLSAANRKIMGDIMWNFSQIGFQFIMNEHGFIPKGAKVYYLENIKGTANVSAEFIEHDGVYLSIVGDVEDSDKEYQAMIKRNANRTM